MNKTKQYANYNKGFTLVELIIVIAIIAILTGIMVPQLIKYVYKAKKASDIQSCDAIGSVFNDLMYDVTDPAGRAMYDFVEESARELKKGDTSPKRYRLLATMNANPTRNDSTSRHRLELVPWDKYLNKGIEEKILDSCSNIRTLEFTKENKMDSYAICCDEEMNIYVFVGGGNGTGVWFFNKDSTRDIYHAGDRAHSIYYMVYPEVSTEYLRLNTPSDIKWANE